MLVPKPSCSRHGPLTRGALALALGVSLAALTQPSSSAAADEPTAPLCFVGRPSVCVLPDPRERAVLVALVVPVGAADEGPNEGGVAHYLEHLAFRDRSVETGAPSAGGEGIDRYGNAYARHEATVYHWTVPPERLGDVVLRALRPLAPPDLDAGAATERLVVAREREQGVSNASARMEERAWAALFAGTAFAAPVLGSGEDIAALTPEAALRFHARHYDADDVVLVVAGAVDAESARAALERARAALPELALLPPRIGDVSDADGLAVRAGGRLRDLDLSLTVRPPVQLSTSDPAYDVRDRASWTLACVPNAPATLPALHLMGSFLTSGLPDAPRGPLEREREAVREIAFSVQETVQGTAFVAAHVTMRPGADADAMEEAWSAWEAYWTSLAHDGLGEATVERLSARLDRQERRQRQRAIPAAWSLIGWLQTGRSVAEWEAYPHALAALTTVEVNGVLERLADPVRTVVLGRVPTGDAANLPAPTSDTLSSADRAASCADRATEPVKE